MIGAGATSTSCSLTSPDEGRRSEPAGTGSEAPVPTRLLRCRCQAAAAVFQRLWTITAVAATCGQSPAPASGALPGHTNSENALVAVMIVIVVPVVMVAVILMVPVAFVIAPAAIVVVVVGMAPIRARIWRMVPAPMDPAVVIPVRRPVAVDPDEAGTRNRAGFFIAKRWRRTTDVDGKLSRGGKREGRCH